jgi:hypothetical protein
LSATNYTVAVFPPAFSGTIGDGVGTRTTGGSQFSSGSAIFPFGSFNIAFLFSIGPDLHLGTAKWTSTPTSRTITQWSYNTTPFDEEGGGIHVTPEPASTIPAIALLAAGAAGVRSWRKRKAMAA